MSDIRDKTQAIARALPLQHNPSCMQFRCDCGTTITFAENSQTFPMLINRTYPAPRTTVGECPRCGAKHWRGTTRRD